MKCTTMQEVEKFLPNSLIGTKKRKAEDDPSDTTCLFSEPKMQDVKRQKLQEFSRLKEQVEQAKRFLQNEPAKKNKKWNKKAAKHQALLKKATRGQSKRAPAPMVTERCRDEPPSREIRSQLVRQAYSPSGSHLSVPRNPTVKEATGSSQSQKMVNKCTCQAQSSPGLSMKPTSGREWR